MWDLVVSKDSQPGMETEHSHHLLAMRTIMMQLKYCTKFPFSAWGCGLVRDVAVLFSDPRADLGLDKTLRSTGSPGGSHRHTSKPYFSFLLFGGSPSHLPGPALQGCVAKDEIWSPSYPSSHQPLLLLLQALPGFVATQQWEPCPCVFCPLCHES